MFPRRRPAGLKVPEIMLRGATPELPWGQAQLLALFDLDDPDIEYVSASIQHLKAAGLDVTDPAILQLAIEGGHRRAAQVEDDLDLPAQALAERDRERRERAAAYRSQVERECRVYYARLGNRCKIGYSQNVKQRMADIQPEELLVTEAGGPMREAERHQQFAALRVTGEWFRYEDALVAHVAALRDKAPART